jgi:hypothetical protein
MILHKLERMDEKIDHIGDVREDSRRRNPTPPDVQQPAIVAPPRESMKITAPISFSAHLMIQWPAVRELLPSSIDILGGQYFLQLEEQRPQLPTSNPRSYADGFLGDIGLGTIRELSEAYFATFNLTSPVLDRRKYFEQTIDDVIESGFAPSTNTCIVLITLALGCWGLQAISEAEKSHNGESTLHADATLGLAFYNEARKRSGFLECDYSMEMCQVHLLSAIYYGQLLRPVDCWAMLTRASTCCLRSRQWALEADDWTRDIYSRLFWITIMIETVLTQELPDLPTSKIRELEDEVPLPRFVQPYPKAAEHDDSFYHYHFLSQIAHRMFLTRVYSSSYYSCKSLTRRFCLANHASAQRRLSQPRPNA